MTKVSNAIVCAAACTGFFALAACGEAGEVGPEGDDTSIHAEENPDEGEDGPME